ncbi:hypothetical protein V2J09_015684 [Rumex salicifolius]
MEEETAVLVKNMQSTLFCRICHEDEFQDSQRLESPCACSGTAKFAHRECIQRWCDEKGNTTCEICLQEYEPGYTAVPKKVKVIEEVMTIRGSFEIPREEDEEDVTENELLDTELPDCSSAADRIASCCKSIALLLTAFLLVRHMCAVISGEEESYPFSLLTIIALKSCGIIIPMYIIIQTITGIQNRIRKYNHLQRLRHLRLLRYNRSHQVEQRLHITIDIQSQ